MTLLPATERSPSAAGMVGRDQLVSLLEAHLRAAPDGCLGLWGMRGLGKTTLAKALCGSLQRVFPGRTCLLTFPSIEQAARGTQQLKQQLVDDAVRMLGIQLQPGAHPEQARLPPRAVQYARQS